MKRKPVRIWYRTHDKKYVYLGKCVAETIAEGKEIIQKRLMNQKDISPYLNISCYVATRPKQWHLSFNLENYTNDGHMLAVIKHEPYSILIR